MGKLKSHSPIYCIKENGLNSFLDTYLKEYRRQIFSIFYAFREFCSMMIIRWLEFDIGETKNVSTCALFMYIV